MFSIAFSGLFGQDAARGISGEPYLRATSTRYLGWRCWAWSRRCWPCWWACAG